MSDAIRASVITTIISSMAWLSRTGYHTLQTMINSLVDTTYGPLVLSIPDGSSTLNEDTEDIRQDATSLVGSASTGQMPQTAVPAVVGLQCAAILPLSRITDCLGFFLSIKCHLARTRQSV